MYGGVQTLSKHAIRKNMFSQKHYLYQYRSPNNNNKLFKLKRSTMTSTIYTYMIIWLKYIFSSYQTHPWYRVKSNGSDTLLWWEFSFYYSTFQNEEKETIPFSGLNYTSKVRENPIHLCSQKIQWHNISQIFEYFQLFNRYLNNY